MADIVAEVEAKLAALNARLPDLEGKANKKERTAVNKEIYALENDDAYVAAKKAQLSGACAADAAADDAAMERRARPVLAAVTAAIAYEKERESELEELDDEERDEEEDKDAKILDRLRQQGPCPAGFAWFRQGNGWRCGGGQHFVYDDDPMLEGL